MSGSRHRLSRPPLDDVKTISSILGLAVDALSAPTCSMCSACGTDRANGATWGCEEILDESMGARIAVFRNACKKNASPDRKKLTGSYHLPRDAALTCVCLRVSACMGRSTLDTPYVLAALLFV